MATVEDMARSHLLNVEREIKALQERKQQIDVDIEKLTSYLTEGAKTLSEKSDAVSAQPKVESS